MCSLQFFPIKLYECIASKSALQFHNINLWDVKLPFISRARKDRNQVHSKRRPNGSFSELALNRATGYQLFFFSGDNCYQRREEMSPQAGDFTIAQKHACIVHMLRPRPSQQSGLQTLSGKHVVKFKAQTSLL